MKTKILKMMLALTLSTSIGFAQTSKSGNLALNSIIPKPLSVSAHTGKFEFKPTTPIYYQPQAQAPISVFIGQLAGSTGVKAKTLPLTNQSQGILFMVSDTLNSLGEEGYRIRIAPTAISVYAKTGAGIFNATQTIRQLLPIQIESKTNGNTVWSIPCGEITDKPRYSWRGYMQDVSRTFYGVEVMKKYMDVIALYKLNVLHLHLTDDQGWRIEIKRYPLLTSTKNHCI
ncbi:family 20 glycosylhydrolase [Pedobacter kyungheensis]|uniref:family 20 glycosylhydrolase n=1 Tax=Pedobacter kyungheensis TaxID=1069985 RepID=UPI00068C58C0|nr:family 20 glycosylhydrolase [Pedobacter kyungheensis]